MVMTAKRNNDDSLPILRDHDREAVIGHMDYVDGVLKVTFNPSVNIAYEDMFNIFSGAGFKVTKSEVCKNSGRLLVREADIYVFSLNSRIKKLDDALIEGNVTSAPLGIIGKTND